jgi:hypothetical protein
LIALDEVFDNVEASLRKVEELKEADNDLRQNQPAGRYANSGHAEAAGEIDFERLVSFVARGNGTTAGEIAAAMLIFDENDPPNAVKSVEDLLETFVKPFPRNSSACRVESRKPISCESAQGKSRTTL